MIYTLTLNPALDITVSTDELKKEKISVTALESVSAGGKGFNTSRALNCLGIKNTAIAFSGGYFKKNMKEFLKREKICARLININGNTRVNIKIIEKYSKKLIELNEAGPEIRKKETDYLLEFIKNLEPKPSFFIISGSLPRNIPAEIYGSIVSVLKQDGTKTLLDASGLALYNGMLAIPDILKINMNELIEVCEKHFKQNPDEAIESALDKGIEMIMITNGPEPVRFYCKTGSYTVISPDIKGPYKTGAGDAVNAGIIYSILNDFNIEEMLRFSIACGNANIITSTPGSIDIAKVNEIAGIIKVIRESL